MASAEYMREWRAKNTERAREIDSASKAKYQERNREYHRQWAARWRAANPEKSRDKGRKFRAKHLERLRLNARERYRSDIEKSREYARKLQAAKYKFVADIKMACGCIDCGFKEHSAALQFDHLPQFEKKFNIGPAIRSRSKQAVMDEIAKCEVRCSNCHAIKTAERRKGN